MIYKLETIGPAINKYQNSIRKLISEVQKEKMPLFLQNKEALTIMASGKAEIWPCLDGFLIAILNSFENDISYTIMDPIALTMVTLFNQKQEEFFLMYDPVSKFRLQAKPITLDTRHSFKTNLIELPIGWSANSNFLSRYGKIILFGSDFANENWIQEHSLFILNYATEIANLESADKAEMLLGEFDELLNSDRKEEELQIFLNDHPEFIFTDYIEVRIKPKIGIQYIADFAFSFKSGNGFRWVFVEIEKPSKSIFTKKNQFTSDFTQAEDQLLNWETQIEHHLGYFQDTFKDVYRPQFLLIYGRNSELNSNRRHKIQTKFSSVNNKFHSTYDDLLVTFKASVKNLKSYFNPNK